MYNTLIPLMPCLDVQKYCPNTHAEYWLPTLTGQNVLFKK